MSKGKCTPHPPVRLHLQQHQSCLWKGDTAEMGRSTSSQQASPLRRFSCGTGPSFTFSPAPERSQSSHLLLPHPPPLPGTRSSPRRKLYVPRLLFLFLFLFWLHFSIFLIPDTLFLPNSNARAKSGWLQAGLASILWHVGCGLFFIWSGWKAAHAFAPLAPTTSMRLDARNHKERR
jgi:hypothetical protein